MSVSPQRIKSKIKTVSNIKKITKAMEAVAASKAQAAAMRAQNAREYARELLSLVVHLSRDHFVRHPYFSDGKGERSLMLMVASNKGLCGSFNAGLMKKVHEHTKRLEMEETTDFVTVGKYAERFAKKMPGTLVGSFIELPAAPMIEDISGLIRLVEDTFTNGIQATEGSEAKKYKRVYIAYTHYVSALKQIPVVRQLLPVVPDMLDMVLSDLGDSVAGHAREEDLLARHLFEPGLDEALAATLERLADTDIYQAVLESLASEHSARMVAMKNATENAGDLVDDMTLVYNTARQSAVTSQIAEISAGAEALSAD